MPSYYTYESSNLRERNKFTSTVNHPAYGVKRYFSSIDTAVYFGADAVEEIVAIDFTIQEPKLPIYGFNSFYPNRMITGRRTVTGTFAINFTSTNYLLNILNNIDDSILASDYDSIINRCNGNNPLFEKEFDITIGYGYSKIDTPSYGASMQSLLGVRIVEYRQALDTEGNPILDMYSFIAKDIEIGDRNVNQLSIDTTTARTVEPVDKNKDVVEDTDKEINYYLANHYIDEERNEMNSVCMNNPDMWGIEIIPTLYQEGSMYYAKVDIEHINKQSGAKVSPGVQVILTDHDKGITGDSYVMTFGKQFTFSNASRDKIKKFFDDKEVDKIQADIEFQITLDGKTFDILKSTYFFKKQK